MTLPSSLLETLATSASGVQMLTGHLDGLDAEGRLLFRATGTEESVPVTIGLEVSDGTLVKAARIGRRAMVLVPGAGGTPVLAALLRERVDAEARDASPGELEVHVDGETLRLTAEKTLELRCGKSRLVLRKDGRVVVQGAHILSASTGPQRIKGATIALN